MKTTNFLFSASNKFSNLQLPALRLTTLNHWKLNENWKMENWKLPLGGSA